MCIIYGTMEYTWLCFIGAFSTYLPRGLLYTSVCDNVIGKLGQRTRIEV